MMEIENWHSSRRYSIDEFCWICGCSGSFLSLIINFTKLMSRFPHISRQQIDKTKSTNIIYDRCFFLLCNKINTQCIACGKVFLCNGTSEMICALPGILGFQNKLLTNIWIDGNDVLYNVTLRDFLKSAVTRFEVINTVSIVLNSYCIDVRIYINLLFLMYTQQSTLSSHYSYMQSDNRNSRWRLRQSREILGIH